MAIMLTGSLDLTTIGDAMRNKHSAFSKGKTNGHNYANVLIWFNDEPDQYGNTVSIQLNSSKEMREQEGKVYVGRAKPLQQQAQQNNASLPADDLPF